jgi:hypothetical protein
MYLKAEEIAKNGSVPSQSPLRELVPLRLLPQIIRRIEKGDLVAKYGSFWSKSMEFEAKYQDTNYFHNRASIKPVEGIV